MEKIKSLLILLALTLTSCYQKTKIEYSDKLTYLTEENMPPIQKLEFEKIELPEDECMNSLFYVYDDTIIIIRPRRPDSYFMSVMNINSKNVLGRYLQKGNGPDEFISIQIKMQQNRLNVFDPSKKTQAFYNIDSIIQLGQSYKVPLTQLTCNLHSLDILSDTSFLFCNFWYMDGCGVNANEKVPELLIAETNKDFNYEPPKECIVVGNFNYEYIAVNRNKDRVFLAYEYKPQFSVLKTNLDTIKIIVGPCPWEKGKYKVDDTFGLIPELYNYYSYQILSTDNYIFTCMMNLVNVPSKNIEEEMRKNSPEIFQFDWDGNLIARYKKDKGNKISGIAGYSESTNTLYINSSDEDGEPSLYKAKIK
jgi:hypothetical protein